MLISKRDMPLHKVVTTQLLCSALDVDYISVPIPGGNI